MARIPSLNWLRVFEAAARHGSFARAAEALNMSSPAVSQQIRALEGYLGKPLFLRGARSVTLTDSGRQYLSTVARSLHSVEVATSDLFGDPNRTHLTLTCSLAFATGWLAHHLPQFQALHPQIHVSISTAILEHEYRHRDADLSIKFGVAPEPFEDSDPLFGERLCPVAPPDIAVQLHHAGDLTQFPLIEIATHRANWQALLPADAMPRVVHVDNTVTAFALAGTGAVALDRAPATLGLVEKFGLVRCLEHMAMSGSQSYSLVYPARTALRTPARLFRDWLLDLVRQERQESKL